MYDNTVTARQYLSYISESAGGFAFIGRDGKLYIRKIYQDEQTIPLELFASYKWGEQYRITKVNYENGIESFKFGDETGNTLWINQENMYIVDEQQVKAIYDTVKDLTANSFEGKTIIDPALDVGDKIIVDGKPIIYQGELDFQGRFIAEMTSKIEIKQKQETTVKEPSQKVINRRVQSRINEAEGKITQLVEENDETSNKLSKVEQDIDGITETVESIETNLNTNYNTKEEVNSKIQQEAGSITQEVNSKIENIQIGGSNLIPNSAPYDTSKWAITENEWISLKSIDEITAPYGKALQIEILKQLEGTQGIYIIPTTNVLEAGKEYCFSLWLKTTKAMTVTVGYVKNGQTNFNITTEWKKYAFKFTATAPTGATHGFTIYLPIGTPQGRHVYVHSVKLEEGNQITAWSPAQNDIATKNEMNSKITQTAESINSEVSKKVGKNEIISKINQSAEAVGIDSDKINLSANDVLNLLAGNTINLSGKSIKIASDNLNVDENGNLACNSANLNNANIKNGNIELTSNGNQVIKVMKDNNTSNMSYMTNNTIAINNDDYHVEMYSFGSSANISAYGGGNSTNITNTGITTPTLTQTSLESEKKNIEPFKKSALEILKQIDIYRYNLKNEKDADKKHIGFVIGDNYKYSKEVTSIDNQGVDDYSFISLCAKAIKELSEENKIIKDRLKKLEKEVGVK